MIDPIKTGIGIKKIIVPWIVANVSWSIETSDLKSITYLLLFSSDQLSLYSPWFKNVIYAADIVNTTIQKM